MTFDELWQTLPIPFGYEHMDDLDKRRWQALVEAAFRRGAVQGAEDIAALKAELRKVNQALDDPRVDNTMTAAEVIKGLRSALKVIYTWCCFPESFLFEETKSLCMRALGRGQ